MPGRDCEMEVHLSPTWKLSTEHPASSEERPVLVDCVTSEAFGPDDLIELYPGRGLAPAADGVHTLAKLARLDAEGQSLVSRFLAHRPRRE